MSTVLALASQLDPESKQLIVKSGLALINSAPLIAASAVLLTNLQWNLEHLAFNTTTRKFKRLSTKEAADVDHNNPNLTSLAPPLMSSAARLADDGLDVAASAASLAQKSIETHQAKGLIGDIQAFLFGTG